jgi:hypothetical protein
MEEFRWELATNKPGICSVSLLDLWLSRILLTNYQFNAHLWVLITFCDFFLCRKSQILCDKTFVVTTQMVTLISILPRAWHWGLAVLHVWMQCLQVSKLLRKLRLKELTWASGSHAVLSDPIELTFRAVLLCVICFLHSFGFVVCGGGCA